MGLMMVVGGVYDVGKHCQNLLPGEGGFSVVPPRRNYGKDGCGFCVVTYSLDFEQILPCM